VATSALRDRFTAEFGETRRLLRAPLGPDDLDAFVAHDHKVVAILLASLIGERARRLRGDPWRAAGDAGA
jgi:hypothetical protein